MNIANLLLGIIGKLYETILLQENIRDLEIYNYILDQKDCLGTSTYLKLLVEKDMKQRGDWSLRDQSQTKKA